MKHVLNSEYFLCLFNRLKFVADFQSFLLYNQFYSGLLIQTCVVLNNSALLLTFSFL